MGWVQYHTIVLVCERALLSGLLEHFIPLFHGKSKLAERSRMERDVIVGDDVVAGWVRFQYLVPRSCTPNVLLVPLDVPVRLLLPQLLQDLRHEVVLAVVNDDDVFHVVIDAVQQPQQQVCVHKD